MSGRKLKTSSTKQQKKRQTFYDKFWRDESGDVVIYRRPNWLITSWFIVNVVYWLNLATPLNQALFGIATVLLAAWSIQELLQGVNYFRRTLGLVVLFFIVVSLPRIWFIVF